MWSFRKANLLLNSHSIQRSLLQAETKWSDGHRVKFNTFTNRQILQNPRQMKAIREEFLAVVKLVERSSLTTRNISTSTRLFDKEASENKTEPQKSSGEDQKPEKTGSDKSSEPKKDGNNKNRKKFDEKDRENSLNRTMATITKFVLWSSLIYSIVFSILVVKSILRGTANPDYQDQVAVSWKEFIQHMLASGEVKELVVRPQYDYVRVILHDDAIIKGRRSRFNSYLLQVPNTDTFEARLREVEKQMGIVETVPVRYERFSEAYGKLFAGIVAFFVIRALLKRMKFPGSSGSPFGMGKAKVTVINPNSVIL